MNIMLNLKKNTANGNDLIYVSKNVLHDENIDEENLLNENEDGI